MKMNILAEHFLLKHLPPEDMEKLAGLVRSRTYKNNQPMFLKGDPASGMMAVARGRVRIVTYSAEGKEVVLRVIGAGERTADAIAMGETEVLILERSSFRPYLESNPALCIKLLEIMCERLRSTSEQLEDFSFLDLETRLAKRLLALAESHGEESKGGVRIALNLSQQMLGAMTGASREAVNKQLRSWEEDGFLTLGRGSVTINDAEALDAIVQASV